jgi:hypothetical protein
MKCGGIVEKVRVRIHEYVVDTMGGVLAAGQVEKNCDPADSALNRDSCAHFPFSPVFAKEDKVLSSARLSREFTEAKWIP